jgi:hypothetical protein
MGTVHDQLSEQFYRWEQRGRGWQVYGEPVHPEPPFVPFDGHYQPEEPVIDDGRRPTFLSSLFRKIAAPPQPPPVTPEPQEEPEPTPLLRGKLVELHTSLPADLDISKEAFEQFFLSLSLCRQPVSFELLGTSGKVSVQFVAGEHDAPLVRRQLQAYFSDAVFIPRESELEQTWITCSGEEELVVEFGLAREFMFSLASGKLDPFVGIVGALSELQAGELGLFQVLWQPVRNDWAESIVRSVTHEDGKPFFVNMPELANAAGTKVSRPLFAAVVRIATKAETFERALQIACDMAGSLRVFSNPNGNELIPLKNELDGYPHEDHIADTLCRQSRRSGMLLNSDELSGFVHLPGSAVRSAVLERDSGKTKAAPGIVQHDEGLLLGNNVHFNQTVPVRLTSEQRTKHCHIIGASGTGKSTLLFNLIRQDIENGEGIAVLDPHGDLVEKILGVIPPERIADVIFVNPADKEYSIGFNILSAHSEDEKTLLASDLVSVFQRLSTSWGDQMQSVLQNAILAFLNSNRGGTLADLRRFLVEPAFRAEFLKSVSDPNILYYWHKGFSHLSGNKSIGPVLTRLEMLLAQRPIAHMVSQPENRLDFGEIMDSGKIFLAKLPEGLLGKENSYLLGALLISKFQQLVMARQSQNIAARRDFWIYIDEFANFITPSMAEILSGARKYRIGLTLAHHELHQLQRNSEVASAVMTHPYTRVVFRVGDEDAKKLSDGFSFFEAGDLKNLETGQAVCRVERSNFDFNLSIPMPEMPDEAAMAERQQTVIGVSRKTYGTPRAQVEAMLRHAWDVESAGTRPTAATKSKPAPVSSETPTPASPIVLTPPQQQPPAPAAETSPSLPPSAAEIPKIAEVPKSPVSQPEHVDEDETEHKAIRNRIRAQAEPLDYSVEFEEYVSGGKKRVDVVLRRGAHSIACEISSTNTIGYETENLIKCLNAGHAHVASICRSKKKLAHIQELLAQAIPAEQLARTGFYTPEEFVSKLYDWAMNDPEGGEAERGKRRKRKIALEAGQLTQAEREQQQEDMLKAIAEAMKPKGNS